MKITLIRKIMAVALLGLFSQFSMADNASSATEVAGILVGMNHFASDADKAKLATIAADDSLAQAVRDMASATANLNHASNDADKALMAGIVAAEQAPERAKVLAAAISGFNHAASADAKEKITMLYEL